MSPPNTLPDPAHRRDAAYVSPKEAARQLGVSRNYIYVLLDRGEITSHRIGKRRLVVATSLDAFIEELSAAEKGA